MISIDEKLYVTKEINEILISYAKDKVLRKLFIGFSFDDKTGEISQLIQDLSFCYDENPSTELQLELFTVVSNFLRTLNKKETLALYFWLFDEKYDYYFAKVENETEWCEDSFSEELGKLFAYMLERPNESEARADLEKLLYSYLISFASEHDLAIIDQCSFEHLEYILDAYCSH